MPSISSNTKSIGITDDVWKAAHARLAASRKTYLRQQNGRLWGRPPSGVASKYLLTGIGRCGHCGAGLEVRSRPNGKRRAYYYSCSSYYRRGKAICPNKYEIPMKAADAAVVDSLLREILTPDRLATVAERAVELAKADQESPNVRGQVERQLAQTQTALERLTAAVTQGGDIPALLEGITAQDARRRQLEQRLEVLARPAVRFDAQLEQQLRDAVSEWREILGRQVPQARQIVQKLLSEKLTFTPEDRDGQRGFRFQATGTVEKLLRGLIPGGLQAMVSPTGLDALQIPIERWFAADGPRRAA